jgi:hypothetical protein
MNKETDGELRKYRMGILADLIQSMGKKKELPVGTKAELISGMLRRFRMDDVEKELLTVGYSWVPNAEYIRRGLPEVISILAERNQPFGHYKEWKIEKDNKSKKRICFWKHAYKFFTEDEALETGKQGNNDISSRADSQNAFVDQINKTWDTNLPHVRSVPLLTD